MSYQKELSRLSLQRNSEKLGRDGFFILHEVFTNEEVDGIKTVLLNHFKARGYQEDPYAVRNLLHEVPALKALVLNSNLMEILRAIEPHLFLTKAIYFDKTPESNWYVTWHQDIVINVNEKIDTPGFAGWTKKAGIHGVVPPDDYLKSTVTIRIHLDDAEASNGALKVIPGSHHRKLADDEISVITQSNLSETCQVKAGGIHIMKPLLLHSSSKATSENRRRVIHLEFNTRELPNALMWKEKQPL
jgi:ectoine hydroxylase-related dioxygenase (phytanoyl-CoA dioxygenase family)